MKRISASAMTRGGRRYRKVLATTLGAAIVSCHVTGGYVRTGPELPGRPEDCAVRVMERLDGANDLQTIGEVHARDGRGRSLKVLLPELKRQACLLGANALTQVEYKRGREKEITPEATRFKSASPSLREAHKDTHSPTSPVSVARAIAVLIDEPAGERRSEAAAQ